MAFALRTNFICNVKKILKKRTFFMCFVRTIEKIKDFLLPQIIVLQFSSFASNRFMTF